MSMPSNAGLQGQGDKDNNQSMAQNFYSPQAHYPLIVATGNPSGQGNGAPGSVFLLQPKRQGQSFGGMQMQ